MQGVSTIIYYPIPIHRQPAYAHLGHGEGTFPVTERLCSEVLSLPIFPELTASNKSNVVTRFARSSSPRPFNQQGIKTGWWRKAS